MNVYKIFHGNPFKPLPRYFTCGKINLPKFSSLESCHMAKNWGLKSYLISFIGRSVLYQAGKAEPPNRSFSKKQKHSTRKVTWDIFLQANTSSCVIIYTVINCPAFSPANVTSWRSPWCLFWANSSPHSVFSPERQPWTSQGDIWTTRSLQQPHCQPRRETVDQLNNWNQSGQGEQERNIWWNSIRCSKEGNIRWTYWRMWMWRYLPKRLELLLRMVLAFPKLSRMGKTSMGWSRKKKRC